MTQRVFEVTGPGRAQGYQVTLDETGVVDVTGLPVESVERMKRSVERTMQRHRLPVLRAFGQVAGSYSTIIEITDLPIGSDDDGAGASS